MLDILRSLEEEKYGKILTKYPIPIFHIEPPRRIQINNIINELTDEKIQKIFDEIDELEKQKIINELRINESN